MSAFSDEEEKELINFESLEILDLFDHYSEIYAAECIDINSGKKKNIIIKMSESKKSFDNKSKSTYSKKQNSNPDKEEISELKYCLYLGLFRNCVPANEKCAKIMKKRDLIGHRVTIQTIEIKEEQKLFHPKEYIFIPPTEETELYFKIDENNSLKITKGENVTMQLGTGFGADFKKEKDLKKFDKNTEQDIANIIVMKTNNKKISENNNNQQKEIKKNEGSENINTEIETRSEQSISLKSMKKNESELSKFDTSSEKELEEGELFFEEKEKGKKYIKYSYFDNFKKEIDGIYYSHSGIKLEKGKKELNIDDYKSYEDFLNKYVKEDKNNDLHGYILMKNFEEEIIDENTPFIIEIKRGFELIKLLKQIKKSAKYVNNLQNFNDKLPKYIIGIICSFSNNNNRVMNQLGELNKKYEGSNSEHKSSQINFLKHITNIITEQNINFVLAVIKDGIINGYNLKKDDYDINYANKNKKRVDLMHMYKTIKIDKLNQEDEEEIEKKISNVSQNFSAVFNTFNNEKTIEMTVSKYEQIIMQEKENKELKEKLETYEKVKKNEDNLIKEKIKIQEEERQKIQEEERKKIQEEEMQKIQEEERKKIQEETRQKIQEEEMQKIQEEERKKIQEETRQKIQEEERQKIQEEERKKIQEEERKKIQDEERKKIQEEKEKKEKEHRSKNVQTPENHEEKK